MIGNPSWQDGALGTTRCIPQAKCHQSHIINPFLTKFVRSRWLDIGLVLFFASLWFVSDHKHAKKGTWPIYSHLDRTNVVNKPYLLHKSLFYIPFYLDAGLVLGKHTGKTTTVRKFLWATVVTKKGQLCMK